MNEIARRLLDWFLRNGRNYPWRNTQDPYKILIAEIMLQRTKADQVEPVYREFVEKFPSPHELNKASIKDIEKFFTRLGLRWRAGLVKALARELVKRFNGKVPENRDELLSLPSVGDYMADAVLSFAYERSVAVVDSNICRILERVFDLKPRGEARRDPKFRKIADKIIPAGKAKPFNWAMIDLAALICTPRNPKCHLCPLCDICRYHERKRQVRQETPSM